MYTCVCVCVCVYINYVLIGIFQQLIRLPDWNNVIIIIIIIIIIGIEFVQNIKKFYKKMQQNAQIF